MPAPLPERTRQLILTELVTNNNNSQVARIFNVSEGMVRKLRREYEDEFKVIRKEKVKELIDESIEWKREFLQRAENGIKKAIDVSLAKMEQHPESIPLNHLATFIGILTDKRAITNNEPTEITEQRGALGEGNKKVVNALFTDPSVVERVAETFRQGLANSASEE